LDLYQEPGVSIEAYTADGEWRAGKTVKLLADSTRPKLRVQFDGSSDEVLIHLGRVILADKRDNGKSYSRSKRSRSRSPGYDWSREKGKSAADLLDEHRKRSQERAVCSSGKDYSKRPVSFMVALPMEQGSASKGLTHEETTVDRERRSRRGYGEERDRSRSPQRSREQSVEWQKKQQELFEKYGKAKKDDTSKRNEVEAPDVMRFG